jgi:hypothetical protein
VGHNQEHGKSQGRGRIELTRKYQRYGNKARKRKAR